MTTNEPVTDQSASKGSGAESSIEIDARGMKCPWPALRAARAMREAATGTGAVMIRADDPIAETELRALATQHGWTFAVLGEAFFQLAREA